MTIIKRYRRDFIGNRMRKMEEQQLFADGYKVQSEEVLKEFDAGQVCCLLILFFPLVFFARSSVVKVTYVKD